METCANTKVGARSARCRAPFWRRDHKLFTGIHKLVLVACRYSPLVRFYSPAEVYPLVLAPHPMEPVRPVGNHAQCTHRTHARIVCCGVNRVSTTRSA